MLVDLALPHKTAHGKLALMSIHERIRAARERKGWSMEQLAKAVSEAENLAKPLAWQTIQQWERGDSAPKRSRMPVVERLLGLTPEPPTERGNASPQISEEPAPYNTAAPVSLPSTYSLLLQLSAAVGKSDLSVRSAVGGLIKHMCENPGEAEVTARRIVAILEVPETAPPRKYTGSQD